MMPAVIQAVGKETKGANPEPSMGADRGQPPKENRRPATSEASEAAGFSKWAKFSPP